MSTLNLDAGAGDECGHHLQSRRIHQCYAVAALKGRLVVNVLRQETSPGGEGLIRVRLAWLAVAIKE